MKRPWGVTGLIVFLVVAMVISGTSALSLALPGSPLDTIWKLKPAAREGFAQLGAGAPVMLGVLFFVMCFAAVGLWRRTRWGWGLTLGAITVNFVADAIHSIWEPANLIGLPIAALVLWYLLRPATRTYFKA